MPADVELVSIKTDTYPLDGLLDTPRGVRPRAAAMIFHGNCHNFYTGPSRFLPEALVADDLEVTVEGLRDRPRNQPDLGALHQTSRSMRDASAER